MDCDRHGPRPAATVCGHLTSAPVDGPPLGLFECSSGPGNYRGWCYACEDLFRQEGTRYTEAFVAFYTSVLVCEACYLELARRHQA